MRPHIINPPLTGMEFCEAKLQKPKIRRIFGYGAGGIRTPGALRHNGFQDRLLQPLGHRSRTHTGSHSALNLTVFVILGQDTVEIIVPKKKFPPPTADSLLR